MARNQQLYLLLHRLDGRPHVFGAHDEPFLPPDLVKPLWTGRGPDGGRALVVEVPPAGLPAYLNHLATIDPTQYRVEVGRVRKDELDDLLGG